MIKRSFDIPTQLSILIATPKNQGKTSGNQVTALRYRKIFTSLGYRVSFTSGGEKDLSASRRFDVLIALHARRSAVAIGQFRRSHPNSPILVVLTGTDLHRDMNQSNTVFQSLDTADQIVLLEPEGGKLLRPKDARKSVAIFQSAEKVSRAPVKLKRTFEVTMLGHLRPVKDPFLAVKAARLLPDDSRIKIVHLGMALNKQMESQATKLSQQSPRYSWIGNVPHGIAQRRLARSQLTILTSLMEGAPSVISEAIVNDVPILATRIHASIGMLGHDYPGFFEVKDARRLAELMTKAETDPKFYQRLKKHCRARKPLFSPKREENAWRELLNSLID